MSNREIAIYASLYADTLDTVEENLMRNLDKSNFKRIEQGTVLVYEDSVFTFSVELHNNSFYLSGRIKQDLDVGEPLILRISKGFINSGMRFSLDYQEENSDGGITSKEFNVSNKMDMI